MLARSSHHAYWGESQRSLRAAGLFLVQRLYPAGLEIPLHSHEHPFLCAVLQGGSTETCDGKMWTCCASTLFLRPAGVSHANRVSEAALRFLGIEFGPEWQGGDGYRLVALRRPAAIQGACTGLTRKLYREFCRGKLASALIVEGLVLEILGEACRAALSTQETGLPTWLKKARDLLHDRYRQPPRLTQLGREVGVNPLYLARLFRHRYGCTVGEYVRRLQVDYACRALARPGLSLVQIALEAGFADQSQLCRIFKEHLGVTPSQFRRESLKR
jgi:AraC family transcriptional regulator